VTLSRSASHAIRLGRPFLLAGWMMASSAAAQAATLTGALPSSATGASLLVVDCSNSGAGEPASLTIQVRDLAPAQAPIVSVQARRNFAAKSSSDGSDGDGTASPIVFLDEGAGRYDIYVDKNAAGEELFEVTAQCWTGAGGSGVATGTSLFAAQGGSVPASSPLADLLLIGALLATGLFGLSQWRRSSGGASIASIVLTSGLVSGIGMAAASEASAHSQSGSLGTAASATDYYEVTCYNDGQGQPGSLVVQIRDASPGAAPSVHAQVHRGLSLKSVSDDLVGDIQPSVQIYLNEGAGVYAVLVDKSGAGAKFYDLTYHCWTGPNGTGVHTGSSLIPRQSE
jgi:hypothetical protein